MNNQHHMMVWDDEADIWYSVCYTYNTKLFITTVVEHHRVRAKNFRIDRKTQPKIWSFCRNQVLESL